jgi:hypothetical protein
MENILDSNDKDFLIESKNNLGDIFICFKTETFYITIEYLTKKKPHTTIIVYKTLHNLLNKVLWNEWIIKGVKNKNLQKQIIKIHKNLQKQIKDLYKNN